MKKAYILISGLLIFTLVGCTSKDKNDETVDIMTECETMQTTENTIESISNNVDNTNISGEELIDGAFSNQSVLEYDTTLLFTEQCLQSEYYVDNEPTDVIFRRDMNYVGTTEFSEELICIDGVVGGEYKVEEDILTLDTMGIRKYITNENLFTTYAYDFVYEEWCIENFDNQNLIKTFLLDGGIKIKSEMYDNLMVNKEDDKYIVTGTLKDYTGFLEIRYNTETQDFIDGIDPNTVEVTFKFNKNKELIEYNLYCKQTIGENVIINGIEETQFQELTIKNIFKESDKEELIMPVFVIIDTLGE